MKNDIDSILDALFSGGKLNVGSGTKSRAAKDAEDFLNSIEKTNANMQSSLNRQISDLDKLTSDAQRSMDEMRRLLDAEGLTGTPEMEAPKAETAEKKPKAKGAEEFGIHAFLASNTLSNEYYPALARMLFRLAAELQQETGCHITFIDLSGGVGIPYRPDEPANDIAVIGEGVRRAYEEILVPAGMGDVALYTELGRFMLAPYGHLVTRAIHEKHIYKEYIGTDACACDLMRPAMYGSYHHITVMGKEDAPCDHKYDIVGGLCENNDKFAVDRMLPGIDIGDLLVIHDAGAHGLAMGYNYNGKLRCAEVLLQPDGSTRLIRRAETPEDYFATMVWDD